MRRDKAGRGEAGRGGTRRGEAGRGRRARTFPSRWPAISTNILLDFHTFNASQPDMPEWLLNKRNTIIKQREVGLRQV